MKDILERVVTYVSKHHKQQIMEYVYKNKIPVTRLLAYAIDQELSKDKPFDNFRYELPSDEMIEYSYIEEATKILRYMKDISGEGLGVDQIIELRHDIGVTDIDALLYGLRECVEKKFLEDYIPKVNPFQKTEYPKGYKFYRITGTGPIAKRKISKEVRDIKRYERLKRKYEKIK